MFWLVVLSPFISPLPQLLLERPNDTTKWETFRGSKGQSSPSSVYTKAKNKNKNGIQGPQKTYFKAYIIHWHGPKGFVVGETKEVLW